MLIGVAVPHRSQSPFHQRHQPFPGHGPAGCPFQAFVRWLGWSSPSTFVRFYNLDVLAGQSPFCLSSNLPCSLDQHCSSPSFAWFVHNYMDTRYHLWDDTQATDDPLGSPCAWCILLTPLGLIPHESWFQVVPSAMSCMPRLLPLKKSEMQWQSSWLYSQTPLP